jgi:hypothetical protein
MSELAVDQGVLASRSFKLRLIDEGLLALMIDDGGIN